MCCVASNLCRCSIPFFHFHFFEKQLTALAHHTASRRWDRTHRQIRFLGVRARASAPGRAQTPGPRRAAPRRAALRADPGAATSGFCTSARAPSRSSPRRAARRPRDRLIRCIVALFLSPAFSA